MKTDLFLPTLLCGLACLASLDAAETVDAQVSLPGGRLSDGTTELVGQFGGLAAHHDAGSLELASGFVGQVANQPPSIADGGSHEVLANTDEALNIASDDRDGDRRVYEVQSGPAHGSLSGSGPDFVYTPDPGYHGSDAFDLVVHDGADRSPSTTVDLTVVAWRRIHVRIDPDDDGPLLVEAQPLSGTSTTVTADYTSGVGASLEPLDPIVAHLLVWIFGGSG